MAIKQFLKQQYKGLPMNKDQDLQYNDNGELMVDIKTDKTPETSSLKLEGVEISADNELLDMEKLALTDATQYLAKYSNPRDWVLDEKEASAARVMFSTDRPKSTVLGTLAYSGGELLRDTLEIPSDLGQYMLGGAVALQNLFFPNAEETTLDREYKSLTKLNAQRDRTRESILAEEVGHPKVLEYSTVIFEALRDIGLVAAASATTGGAATVPAFTTALARGASKQAAKRYARMAAKEAAKRAGNATIVGTTFAQTAGQGATSKIRQYMEKTGDYNLEYYDPTRDFLVDTGVSTLSALVEKGLGVERFIPSVVGRVMTKDGVIPNWQQILLRGVEGYVGESAEEGIQNLAEQTGEMVSGYREWGDFDWEQILTSMTLGGIIGGAGGSGLYYLNRRAAIRQLQRKGIDKDLAADIVDTIASREINKNINNISAAAEITTQQGQAYDKLKAGIKSALEAQGWSEKMVDATGTALNIDEYAGLIAKNLGQQAIKQSIESGLPIDSFLDVASFANINNVLYLRPLGTAEDIQKRIAEQDAIIARQRELKKTGAGDDKVLQQARMKRNILQNAYVQAKVRSEVEKVKVEEAQTPEIKQEITNANTDSTQLTKAETKTEFDANLDPNLTTAEKDKRFGNAVIKKIFGKDKFGFDSVMTLPEYTEARNAIITSANRIFEFAKAHRTYGLYTDLRNALKKMQTVNAGNFIDSITTPNLDGVDVVAENAFLYHFIFSDAPTISAYIDAYLQRAEASITGGTQTSLSKKDLVGQAFKATDDLMQVQAESAGIEYTSIYDSTGALVDKNVMAVLVSYQNQFVSEEPTMPLKQEVVAIDLTKDFNDFSKDSKKTAKEYIDNLIGQVIGTSTEPLKIQITKENRGHIVKPKKMGKTTTKRHTAALQNLESIISGAVKTGESEVDLSHNTAKKTLAHKRKVEKYVYFTTPIKINNDIYYVSLSAEQVKGQDSNVLDLYDVNVKKEPDTNYKLGSSGSYDTIILEQNDIVNQDFRDGHRAPSYSGESLEFRLDQAGDFSLEEVAQGNHNQPSDYFSPVGARMYGYDTLSGRQSKTAIDNIIRGINAGKTDLTITAYRAVPKDLQLDHLIVGDWITFSEQYAIDHGEHRFGENEYKIIKQEVSIKDVWWDGNDINEWGFDDSWRGTPTLFQGRAVNGFYDPELSVIVLGRNMNEMTLPHELAHYWLDTIFNIYQRVQSGELKVKEGWLQSTKDLFDMVGIDQNQTQLTKGQHEKFARMTEAYLTGIGVSQTMNQTFKEYLSWIPAKYKSIAQLAYLDDNGKIQLPFLDQTAVDFFNRWYENPSLPSLESSPERERFMNVTDDKGDTIKVSIKEMNDREKEFGQDAEEQERTDQRLYNTLDENMPADIKPTADAQKVVIAERGNFLKDSEQQQRRWFERKSRDTEAQLAQDYIEKNPEHAKEVIYGDPELVPNDTGIDRATLINAYMALNNITPKDEDWARLHTNIAINQSLAGTQLALSNDKSYQTYLDALREIESALELKAATNYAGSKRGAIERFNRDIQRFLDRELPSIFATEPNTKERETALRVMFEKARTTFSGNTTGGFLMQEDLDYAKAQKGSSEAFIRWAMNQIKKDAGAKLSNEQQAKLLEISAKAQQALVDIDNPDSAKAVAAAQELRKWQQEKQKMMGVSARKFSLFGDYAPRAMLASINTLFFANVPSTAMNTLATRVASSGDIFGKNDVSESLINKEVKRIKAIYGATSMNLAQMEKPTSPSLLHGEKYSASGQKRYDPYTILGKEDNFFRVPTFVNTLARIASTDAKATGRKADEVFKEYLQLNNQTDGAKLARKQALAVANMAVFTQDGALASCLNHIRSELNKASRVLLGLDPQGFGLGNLLAPFLTTGANIAEMGVRGSLAPVIQLTTWAKQLRTGKALDPMNKLALRMDWTYFTLSAVAMVLLGALTSDDDEFYTDPYRTGIKYDPNKPYDSINIAGVWVDLDFFGAFAIPMRTAAMFMREWKKDNNIGSAVIGGYTGSAKNVIGDVPLVESIVNNQFSWAVKQPGTWAGSYTYTQLNKLVPAQIKPVSRAISRGYGFEYGAEWMGKSVGRKFHRNYGFDGAELTTQDLIEILTIKAQLGKDAEQYLNNVLGL